MDGIKWTNHKFGTKKVVWYKAEVGCLELWCRQVVMVRATKNKRSVKEWDGTVYFGNEWVASIPTTRKLFESAKKDVERLAIKYLVGYNIIGLKALKKIGLLEEILSEVGVDL